MAGAPREYGPGRGEVTIEYAALTFGSPAVQFRYRLDGLDTDWVAAGARRTAYYAALPPKRYRFEVMASNPDGAWIGTPASLAFTIRPPFVRTPLFYGLCAAAIGLAGASAYRLRVRQVRARFAAVLAERTRIARELHDTLAQGMAGIRLQIETGLRAMEGQPGKAREHLQLAEAMARSGLAEVRRSIWVLRAQSSKSSDGLVASFESGVRQLTAGSALNTVIEIQGAARELPSLVEHSLLRITHELVQNAVRHSHAATLTVVLQFDGDIVRLIARDDGCGFDADAPLAAGGDHFGLIGVVERVDALGGRLTLKSRPGAGAEVVCELPTGSTTANAEEAASRP
jgi:signal transduction histidine kinase